MRLLERVRLAAQNRTLAQGQFELAIREAVEAGHALRTVAKEADLSHESVRRILKREAEAE